MEGARDAKFSEGTARHAHRCAFGMHGHSGGNASLGPNQNGDGTSRNRTPRKDDRRCGLEQKPGRLPIQCEP